MSDPRPIEWRLVAGLGVLLAVSACASLSAQAPAGLDLSGHWRLDRTVSDDPFARIQAALAMARPVAGEPGERRARERDEGRGLARPPAAGGLPHGRVAEALNALVRTGDELVVEQGGSTLRMTYALAGSELYRFGDEIYLQSPAGSGQRASGWDDTGYVIETDLGHVKMSERYRLSTDGTTLHVNYELRGEALPQTVHIERVYRRAPPGDQRVGKREQAYSAVIRVLPGVEDSFHSESR